MKWPDINAYISSFEELLCLAEYTAGNNESANLFLRRLPRSIATKVMKAPLPTGYEEMKQKAIDATRSSQIIQSMFSNQGNSRGSNTGNWRAAQQGKQPPQQFFQRPQQNMRGWTPPDTSTNRNSIRNWTPPINSSTAPPAFNNRPVPMDLSHSRAPNQWG